MLGLVSHELNVIWSNVRKQSRGSSFPTTALHFGFFSKPCAQPRTEGIVATATTTHTPKGPNKNLVHPLCQQRRNKKIVNGKPTKNFNVVHLSQFYESGTDFFFTHTTNLAIVDTQDKLEVTSYS